MWAGLISNLGALLLVGLFLFSKKFRTSLKDFFKQVKNRNIPLWFLAGGFFGSIYVATSAFAVAAVGTGLFTIGVVASANLTSLVVDKFGFASEKIFLINTKRVMAAFLAIIAVTFAGFNPQEKLLLIPLLVILLAGIAQVFQLAFNSKLAHVTSSKIATFVNFPIAVLFGLFFVLALHLTGRNWPIFPTEWWLYTAGILGGIFVLIAAWLVKRLGVLVFTLATISGQLITALILDIFFTSIDVGWQLISGAVLVLVAVYLASELR